MDWDTLEAELEDLSFDGFDFDFGFDFEEDEPEDEEEDDTYTNKTDIPQYEPSGNDVTLDECCNEDKYTELLQEINNANLAESEKAFLCLAAARHLQFNYKKIADYYAGNASEEMQKLMEKSALVIIDYGDAVKNGYVKLSANIERIMKSEA